MEMVQVVWTETGLPLEPFSILHEKMKSNYNHMDWSVKQLILLCKMSQNIIFVRLTLQSYHSSRNKDC